MNGSQFQQYIIDKLDLEHLAPGDRVAVLDRLGRLAMQEVIATLLDAIPESERAEFDRLVAADDDAGMMALTGKHVPDFDEKISTIVERVVNEYRELVVDGEEAM